VKSEELKHALRLLAKMLADPRLGPDHVVQLRRAQRELTAIARSGKFDRHRVFRAVQMVAEVLNDLLNNRNP
jgi:hypothetical protein